MKTSAIKGTVFLSAATGVFIISGYIINIFLGRFLGPVDYGIYGVVVSLISFVNIIQTTGITQAVSKHVAEEKVNNDAILKTGYILQGILNAIFFLIFFVFADGLAKILHDNELAPYIRICAFIFPFYGIYALFLDYYNGLHYFKKQALMNILYSVSKVFFVLVLVYFFKLYGVFYGFVFASLLPLFVGARLPKKHVQHFSIKKLLLFSIPLIGIAVFSNLLLSIDLFSIKILSHIKENPGFYTASQNIAKIIFFSMSALFLVIFPSISHAISHQFYDKTKQIIQKSLRMMLLVILPVVFMLSATSKDLIIFIYNSHYIPAASSLAILLFGIGAFSLFTALNYILSGAGKPYVASLFSFIGLVISGIFCIMLIPRYSIIGAATATTIGSTCALICASLYVFHYFHTFIPIKSIIKITVASFIVYWIAHYQIFPLLLLPVFYLLIFSLYLLLLIILKEINMDDLALVKSVLPKWQRKN